LQLGPHSKWDRVRETPDHDALARWEGEGGAPPLDESNGPSH
jgi:hypothetical protein